MSKRKKTKKKTPPERKNFLTGYREGSPSDLIAKELMIGGKSREDVVQRIKKKRLGIKQVELRIQRIEKDLCEQGFEVQGRWRVWPDEYLFEMFPSLRTQVVRYYGDHIPF